MEGKKFVVLMIYDIVDNKRRVKMVRCLESFGIRVQKSAFEGYLTKKQYEKMMEKSKKIIDVKADSFRVYIVDNFVDTYSWGIDKRKNFDCFIL